MIRKQKFLELLELKKTHEALSVLRFEVGPLSCFPDQLQFLSRYLNPLKFSLIMYKKEDIYDRADWDGSQGESRVKLLESLQGIFIILSV